MKLQISAFVGFLLMAYSVESSQSVSKRQLSSQALDSGYVPQPARRIARSDVTSPAAAKPKPLPIVASQSLTARPQKVEAKTSSKAVQSTLTEELGQKELKKPKPVVKDSPRHKIVAAKKVSPNALLFGGLEEKGVSKNTFLCQGAQFSGSICTQTEIDGAVGFDISGGKTLQFFNNFGYWLIKKEHRKIYIKDDLRYEGAALENKLNQEGWGATNAYCLLVSTDPLLQQVALPGKKAPVGKVKVVAQLLYSGQDLIQLWSQDVVFMDLGQEFKLVVSSDSDTRLATMFSYSAGGQGVMGFIEKLGLQANNRKEETYNQASDSPRMVRIELA